MSLFDDSNPKVPKEMPAGVHSRTMVLRDFQRDFVWAPGVTQALVVSIARNYLKVAAGLETAVETAV
jgi:hypothetical protein